MALQTNGKKKGKSEPLHAQDLAGTMTNAKVETEQDLMVQIEEHHKCQEHGRACFVQSNGDHYQYTIEDITIWASLLVWFLFFPRSV